jgi:hypothetical protein
VTDRTDVDTVQRIVSDVNWGQPNLLLAAVAAGLMMLFSTKKKRKTIAWVVSAIAAGTGFLLSGWVGVLTLSMAISYRVFQPLKAPWQAIITWTAGLSAFALFTWLIQLADPKAADERSQGNTSGFFGWINTVTDFVATNTWWLAVCAIGGLVATIYVYWKMHAKVGNPYRNMGAEISADMMYNGVRNKDLKPLPESRRDPARTFSAKVREEKLGEQDGLCAYQLKVSQHPRWEPYRSGIQWEGDHIIPHAAGGATNYVNLQVLCADCNSAKSSKCGDLATEAVVARWKTRGSR